MRSGIWLIAGVLVFLPAGRAEAEKVSMGPDELRATATHVIVGRVQAIYTRQQRSGSYLVTHHAAEVKVTASEKGAGVKKGDLLFVRYWTQVWKGPGFPPPGTGGHRDLPAAGETLRIYLARNAYDGFGHDNKDGGFNVIGANGFERLGRSR
jgi:hypothetical protein